MLASRLLGGVRGFSTASSKIGFVGLGQMGAHMARNLVKTGHSVVVYDVAPDAVASLVDAGAEAAGSPAEVASQTSKFVTMLPSSPHVKQVYIEDGVLDAALPGALIMDCSTIDPATSQTVSAAAAEKGLHMVDAPVSGGVGGAEAGTLTFMVGGSDDNFTAAKDVLQHMGQNIVHCGGAGTGQVAKLCNNLVLGISMIAVSEGMALGKTLGMDPSVLAGILNTSSGRCWSSDTYNPCPGVMEGVPSSRGYTGGFASALMRKDLGLAADAAKAAGVPLPTGGVAFNMYSLMCQLDYGGKDFSSVYKLLSQDPDA